MIQTVEAVIDEQGKVQLLQNVRLPQSRRALVTILEETPVVAAVPETALLSETALAEDWNETGGGRSVVIPSVGAVVLVRFPFSDLSGSKLRPAMILADTTRGDWILCQITSQPYTDSSAVKITSRDLITGAFKKDSYARPGKLFTANSTIMTKQIGELKIVKLEEIIKAVISLLEKSIV